MTGHELADQLEVSIRTLLWRHCRTDGPACARARRGKYRIHLDKGYDLPPLMLAPDELETAVLGASWVARNWRRGALDLIARLTAVAPRCCNRSCWISA